jgi:tripartite-type tricarboxylate transporter receptor subunit TctC
LTWVLFIAASIGVSGHALAQKYPVKSVRLVLPFAAGSAVDMLARLYAQKMTENWGQQVLVDNRTGANGIIGMEIAARAPADGYTVGMGNIATLAINPNLYAKLPYDVLRDFAPVSYTAAITNCLVVHPSLPVKSVKDLLALARAKPGGLDCASAGRGSSTHMAFELFKTLSGVTITHIPYKGTGPALVDAMAGQVHMLFGNVLSTLSHVKTGRLRALAVTTAKRSTALPDLPTIAESGVPGYDNSTWHGWLAPAGTPPAILNRLNAELVKSARAPDVVARLAPDGGEAVGSTPEEFAQHIATEIARWRRVVREAGVRVE